MDFVPRFVFKSPGEIKSAGLTYDQKITNSEKEYNDSLKEGYFSTLQEAFDKKAKIKKVDLKDDMDF